MTYTLIIKSPNWETGLFVETTKLFISNCVRVYRYIVKFSNFMSRGGRAFDSMYCPEGRVFAQMIVPGGGFLLPSSLVQGVCPRGDGYGWNWSLYKSNRSGLWRHIIGTCHRLRWLCCKHSNNVTWHDKTLLRDMNFMPHRSDIMLQHSTFRSCNTCIFSLTTCAVLRYTT